MICRNRWFFRQYGADSYLSMEQDIRARNRPSYPPLRWITAVDAILCGFIKPPGTRPMNFARHALWLFGILTILARPLMAAEYAGKVVGVSDGDTLTLLVPDGASFKQVKVRLGEIDTPESKQPYGERAKQILSDLAFGKQARVMVQDTDKYGRTVGRVYVGGVDVNAEMVKQGAAWVYRQYAKDQTLFRLEEQAKATTQGLWGLPEAQRCPPWDWRKGACATASVPAPRTPVTPTAAPTSTASSSFTCAGKRYCREMTSCEEAKFYLNTCGVGSLDGNRDGVPCAKLCR